MTTRKMLKIAFTDGRNTEVLLFDPAKDTEVSTAFLIARMKENGWYPVKGSNQTLLVENGEARPYTEPVQHSQMLGRKRAWKMA